MLEHSAARKLCRQCEAIMPSFPVSSELHAAASTPAVPKEENAAHVAFEDGDDADASAAVQGRRKKAAKQAQKKQKPGSFGA